MPRYFLFGLVRVPMYEYYWGHTAAQIELIDIDQPIIVYKKSESRGNGIKPGDKGYRPDPKKLDEAVRKWKKRKSEREKRGFSLNTFLRTGEKVPVDNDNTRNHITHNT